MTRPMTQLLKKNGFCWDELAQKSFQLVKEALVQAPVLRLPDYTKPFILEVNACDEGLGAVLMQDHHPIAYISKALGPRQKGLSIYEKEMLALVYAVDKWRHYLVGRHFIIRTDHQSLKFLLEQRVTTPSQQK